MAECVALGVYGVKAVVNDVTVRLGDGGMRTDTDIAQALTRNAEIDARRINVAVIDSKVIVSGNVHSC